MAMTAIGGSVLSVLLFVAESASAANFEGCSPGVRRTWDRDPPFVFDSASLPNQAFSDDLQLAVDRWNSVRGMFFEIASLTEDTTPGSDIEDEVNELVFVSGLDERAAALVRFFPWLFGCTVFEADVLFDADTEWESGPHDPAVLEVQETNLTRAAVHEIGHVLGLEHEDDVLSTMMTFDSPFWSGDPNLRAHPFPDDVFASRVLYFHPNDAVDLAISHFRREPPDFVRFIVADETHVAVPGRSFGTGFGVGNLGTEFAQADAVVVLSPDEQIDTSDPVLGSFRISMPPGVYQPFTVTVTIPPDTPPGEYYLGAILDPANELSERREGNNRTRFPGTLRVQAQVQVMSECIEDSDCPEPGQTCSADRHCAYLIDDD